MATPPSATAARDGLDVSPDVRDLSAERLMTVLYLLAVWISWDAGGAESNRRQC
jgi:hypothetical protein